MKTELLNKLQMPDPYLNFTPYESFAPSGWNSFNSNLNLAKDKKVCLEIGSWMGESAKTISSIISEGSVLICCDNFLGSHEHFIDKTVPLNGYGKPMLYECFLTNTINHKDKIIPIMLSSSSAMEVFRRKDIKFDFIYIDGDHRENAVYNDIKESYERLNSGGVILGDDFSWGTVQDGVSLFKKEFGVECEIKDGQYIIRKD